MMQHDLFTSIDDLLASDTLGKLTGHEVTQVRCSPINGGASGARLLAVEVSNGGAGERYVLKRMSPEWDWIMLASEDHHCRSIALWQHGLLDRFLPRIDHTILACAFDGQEWAMLMRDVSTVILSDHQPRSEYEVQRLLDAMALMHATFWNAAELADSKLSLCNCANLLRYSSPETARRFPIPESFIPVFVSEGWALLLEAVEPDVADVLQTLITNPQPLHDTLERYPFTLIHGDYRSENLGLGSKPWPIMALDWGWSGYGTPTIDLAWFMYWHDVAQAPFSVKSGVDYYRSRLANYLGTPLDDETWQPMWELGVLVNILRVGCLRAWFVANADDEDFRAIYRKLMTPIDEQVRAAARWL